MLGARRLWAGKRGLGGLIWGLTGFSFINPPPPHTHLKIYGNNFNLSPSLSSSSFSITSVFFFFFNDDIRGTKRNKL